MHPNTFKISILRDPVSNFMSSWKYYNGLLQELRKDVNSKISPKIDFERSPNFNLEMETFLKSPWEYLSNFPYQHAAYLFVVNPQLIFFGFPTYLLKNFETRLAKLVDIWIREIANDFDHMLILEGMFWKKYIFVTFYKIPEIR